MRGKTFWLNQRADAFRVFDDFYIEVRMAGFSLVHAGYTHLSLHTSFCVVRRERLFEYRATRDTVYASENGFSFGRTVAPLQHFCVGGVRYPADEVHRILAVTWEDQQAIQRSLECSPRPLPRPQPLPDFDAAWAAYQLGGTKALNDFLRALS